MQGTMDQTCVRFGPQPKLANELLVPYGLQRPSRDLTDDRKHMRTAKRSKGGFLGEGRSRVRISRVELDVWSGKQNERCIQIGFVQRIDMHIPRQVAAILYVASINGRHFDDVLRIIFAALRFQPISPDGEVGNAADTVVVVVPTGFLLVRLQTAERDVQPKKL